MKDHSVGQLLYTYKDESALQAVVKLNRRGRRWQNHERKILKRHNKLVGKVARKFNVPPLKFEDYL